MTPEEPEIKEDDHQAGEQQEAIQEDGESPSEELASDGSPPDGREAPGDQSGDQVEEGEAEADLDPQAQAAEYLEGWQRARAEFSNYKKRVDRELQDAYARAAGDIITRYLSILDDLERAMVDIPEEEKTARWAEGIDLIYRKMKAMIEAEGVEAIEAEGQPFDPTLHEAISHEESDELREGYVIDVVQQGYMMGDRVLRPAMVRVAK